MTSNLFSTFVFNPLVVYTVIIIIIITSLPKVIWEQGRVADLCQGAGCHQGSRIRSVCRPIVFLRYVCRVYAN